MKRILLFLFLVFCVFYYVNAQTTSITIEVWPGENYECNFKNYTDAALNQLNIEWDKSSAMEYVQSWDNYTRLYRATKYCGDREKVSVKWKETNLYDDEDETWNSKSHTWYFITKDNPLLTTTEMNLNVGDQQKISYVYTYDNEYTSYGKVTYKSQDASVATVDALGNVTAVGYGRTDIVVSSTISSRERRVEVNVKNNNTPLTVSASPSGGMINCGKKVYLTAKAGSSVVQDANIYYTLDGSSPSTASQKYTTKGIAINEDCTLKAIAYKEGYTNSSLLTTEYSVNGFPPTSIKVIPKELKLNIGEEYKLSYSLSPSDAKTEVQWSAKDKSIVSVNSTKGVVRGLSPGFSYVWALTSNGLEGYCKVTVSPPSEISDVVMATAGEYFSLALTKDGTLWGCGTNSSGALGLNSSNGDSYHVLTRIMGDVSYISAGNNFTLIIKNDGSLWACGNNEYGQLGNGTNKTSSNPIKIMDNVSIVSAGQYHSLIIKSDGSLWACGNNSDGQLGDDTGINRNIPVKIADNVKSASAGKYHSLIVNKNNELWACGRGFGGRLGNNSETSLKKLKKISDGIYKASAGGDHSLLLDNDGILWGCGYNFSGQLGDSNNSIRLGRIRMISSVTSVFAGGDCSFVLRPNQSLYACGKNNLGQLGNNSNLYQRSLVRIMDGVASVSCSGYHTLIVKTDGSLWACGLNCYGELGDGTTTNSLTPVRVLFSGYSEIESIIDNNPISADTEETLYYDLNGIQRQQLKKGLNIVRTKGSKVKKILIK